MCVGEGKPFDLKDISGFLWTRFCHGESIGNMLRYRFFEFLRTAGSLGWGSVVLAVILFTITIFEHIRDHNVTAFVVCFLGVFFFCLGAYLAWSKERVARNVAENARAIAEAELADRRPKLTML